MRKRTIVLVPAVLAVFAATGTMTAPAKGAAAAAEECASKPGVAEAGAIWKYRTDRATGRRCWFLAEGSSARRAASSKRRAAMSAAEPPAPDEPAAVEPAPVAPAKVERARQTVTIVETRPAPDLAVRWTELPQWSTVTKGDRAPTTAPSTSSYVAEDVAPKSAPAPTGGEAESAAAESAMEAQDEMPLVWPDMTTEGRATGEPADRPTLRLSHVLALVAGVFTLAGMMFAIVGLPGASWPVPADRRGRPSGEANMARARQRVVAPRPPAAREMLKPGDARREFEARLPWLIDAGRKRTAA
jgi:hypothetical protein